MSLKWTCEVFWEEGWREVDGFEPFSLKGIGGMFAEVVLVRRSGRLASVLDEVWPSFGHRY